MGQISTSGCGSGVEPRPVRLPCWGWIRAGGRCSGTGSNDDQAHDDKPGELRHFQWLTPDESADVMVEAASAGRVREEMADVLAYLLRLSDVLGVDLEAALAEKIVKNAMKYPVETAQGVATSE